MKWYRWIAFAPAVGILLAGGLAPAQRPSLRLEGAAPPPASAAKDATPAARAAKAFTIVESTPQGPVTDGAVISVTFSQDVVTSDALDARATSQTIFSFEPRVEGSIQWDTLRRAHFLPAHSIHPGTEYIVRINPELRSQAGIRLTGPTEYRFQTPALNLTGVSQYDFHQDHRVSIKLTFSDVVRPQDLRRHLKLISGGSDIPWKPGSEVASRDPIIITDPLTTDVVKLVLEPGLRGVSGPLALKNRIERRVPLSFRLVPVELKGFWKRDTPTLRLKFSSSVYPQDAEKFISVDPPVKLSFSSENNDLVIRGAFQAEQRYTVHVKKGLSGYSGLTLTDATLSTWMPQMPPFMDMPDAGGYLSSQGTMKLRVETAGLTTLSVEARRVFDNNMLHYDRGSGWYAMGEYSKKIADREIALRPEPNKAVITYIDLKDLLGADAHGIYGVEVRGSTTVPLERTERYHSYPSFYETASILITNIGLVGKVAPTEVQVFAAALNTAAPMAGVQVQLISNRYQPLGEATTDASGIARFSNLAYLNKDEQPAFVIARTADGGDVARLELNDTVDVSEEFNADERDYLHDRYEAFITPERGAYRPGETVHITGFIRGREAKAPPAAFPLEAVLRRPDNKYMTPFVVIPTAPGVVDFTVTIPAYAPTGYYTAALRIPGKDEHDSDDSNRFGINRTTMLGEASFNVEDFIPNRLKVEADAADERYGVGNPLRVDVKAEEMFGQPVANQAVSGSITWEAASFHPKDWKDFTFGDAEKKFSRTQTPLKQRRLGSDGKTSITLKPPTAPIAAALQATVQVTVKENGRGVTRTVKRTVDPVPYYIGLRNLQDTYLKPGENASFDVVAVEPGGQLTATDTVLTGTISSVRWNTNLVRNRDSYEFRTSRQLDTVADTSVTLTGGRGTFQWQPSATGNYLIRLSDTRTSSSVSSNIYVSDNQWDFQPWNMEEPEQAELVLDNKDYSASETARLLIKAPFPGTVLLTLEQDHVLSSTVITMEQNTLEVPIALDESMMPNVYAVAEILRPVKPADKWLPHRALGRVNIPVRSEARKIDIALQSPNEVKPGDELTVTAQLHDAATSQPVASADVVVWAVDEGILTLTDFKTPDPADFFFAARRLLVQTADFFGDLMPDLLPTANSASATGGGDMGDGRLSPVPSERVKPVVLWHGPLQTDTSGSVVLHWKVPEYMGRLRIMAIAASGASFGSADQFVFVRNPIMVKEHLPRFVAPGDQFTAGFTLYNNTDAATEAFLKVSSGGPVVYEETSASVGQIAPRGQVTVTRPMSAAADQIGSADISFSGAATTSTFGTSVSLPVRPASPRVTFSDSLTIAEGNTSAITLPGGDLLPATTTVTLTASGLPDLDLAGAFHYNIEYPYGCTEQVVSKLFPLLYLQDLARDVNPDRYSADGIRQLVQAGIDRLFMAQTISGGLSLWVGESDPWRWGSVYAAHFLTEARKAGYYVDDTYYDELMSYLHDELQYNVSENSDYTIRAYICYVFARADRKLPQRMEELYDARKKLSTEAKALLGAAYLQCGLPNEARQLADAPLAKDVDPTSVTRTAYGIIASPIRETAIQLLTWSDINVQSPEAADLARRLLGFRHQNHWGTTQDNAFTMLALGRYRHQLGAQAPVHGTVRINGEVHEFSTSSPLRLSGANLAGARGEVQCDSGTAYLSYVVEGVPLHPSDKPLAQGATLERRYLDRSGKPVDLDAIRQGELLQVELIVSGGSSYYNAVIQDLLPGGLEIENPRLASSENVSPEDSRNNGISVQRLDVRDDRMLIFGDIVKNQAGHQTYRYTVRAVTPGEFIVPPASLEVMYDPRVQARTATTHCTIVPYTE